MSGASHTDRKVRRKRSAAASRARRRPVRSPRAGRRAAPARPGRGRPWCRSSGAPAPGRPRRRPRPRGSSYRRSPCSANARPRRGEDLGPGVGGAGTAAAGGRVMRGRVRRVSAPARRGARGRTPATRAGRPRARRGSEQRRVLISSTTWPAKPRAARWAQEGLGPHHPAAGHEVLVLGRAGAVGEVDVAQPVAHPLGHLDHVAARDGRVREVDRGVGVVLRRWGPSRGGTSPCRDARRPATDTCSPPRRRCRSTPPGRRCPRRSRRRSPSASGTAGVRRPRRRRPRPPSRRSARACPTGRCPRPAG